MNQVRIRRFVNLSLLDEQFAVSFEAAYSRRIPALLFSRDRGISFSSLNQRGNRGRLLRAERSEGAEFAARRRACG
jgi:hypothetical protein